MDTTTRLGSMFGYGVGYAVASLSCTIGPFLAVTGSSLRTGSLLDGVLVYVAYAAGITLVVGVLAVAVALANSALIDRIRRVLPYLNRISGAVLIMVGLYVGYYGLYEIRLFHGGGSAQDPVIGAAAASSGRWPAGCTSTARGPGCWPSACSRSWARPMGAPTATNRAAVNKRYSCENVRMPGLGSNRLYTPQHAFEPAPPTRRWTTMKYSLRTVGGAAAAVLALSGIPAAIATIAPAGPQARTCVRAPAVASR